MGSSVATRLEDLHLAHPGLTEAMAWTYAEAAAVSMTNRHSSPTSFSLRWDGEDLGAVVVAWDAPSAAAIRGQANAIDRTEIAAYCIAIASAGARLEHVCLRRVAHGDGADWFLLPIARAAVDDPDLDLEDPNLVRLEVSGIDDETDALLRRRVNEKVDQVRAAAIPGSAWAAVVGFTAPRIWFAIVES